MKGKKDKIGRWKKLIACLKTVFGISIFVFLNKKKILLTTKKLFSIFLNKISFNYFMLFLYVFFYGYFKKII